MPYRTLAVHPMYGADWGHTYRTDLGCTHNLSSCTVTVGRALAVSPDEPGCVYEDTCTWVSSGCNTRIATYLDLSGVGKQALKLYWSLIYTSFHTLDLFRLGLDGLVDVLVVDSGAYPEYFVNLLDIGEFIPMNTFMVYGLRQYSYYGTTMYWKVYRGVYDGLFQKVEFYHCAGVYNVFLGVVRYAFSMESSPIAVIPLNYEEYSKYSDLRRIIGYSYDGINQPSWNVSDMINILTEIFPDRVWMVFEDSNSTLYGYGITLEQLPSWLVSRLNPTSFKVLREPWDSQLVQRFIYELETRNYVGRE